jgi:hypothetical protein
MGDQQVQQMAQDIQPAQAPVNPMTNQRAPLPGQ